MIYYQFQGNSGNSVKLIKNKLNYLGLVDLTQYFMKSFTIHDDDELLKTLTNGNKGVQIEFIFSRRLLNQILTVFLPTISLVIVSFCTSFFKVKMSACYKGAAVVYNFSFSPQILRPV